MYIYIYIYRVLHTGSRNENTILPLYCTGGTAKYKLQSHIGEIKQLCAGVHLGRGVQGGILLYSHQINPPPPLGKLDNLEDFTSSLLNTAQVWI